MTFWKILRNIYCEASEEMVEAIREYLKKGEKILDLGCGSGILAKKLQEKLKVKVIGIDIVDKAIEKINFKKYNGKRIPFKNNSFDLILISFVLHHTQDVPSLLKEAKRVAKRIIIFEDLPEGTFDKIRCFLHWFFWNIFVARKFNKFNFFKEQEWEKLFAKLELKLIAKKEFLPKYKFLDPVKRKIFVLTT